jgi:hypothetical protein
MRVDQTRHYDPSATIDHSRTFRWRHVTGRDLLDAISLDKETEPSAQDSGPAVEELKIAKNDWRHVA